MDDKWIQESHGDSLEHFRRSGKDSVQKGYTKPKSIGFFQYCVSHRDEGIKFPWFRGYFR